MSIIYKGFDLVHSRKIVIIKEYCPVSYAERDDGANVYPRPGYEKNFHEGAASFQQEAEIMRSLIHPHIVPCHGLVRTHGLYSD